MSIWGDKINENQLVAGTVLDISLELESREFNNKWYTDVKSWKIETSNTKVPMTENNEAVNTESFLAETENDEDNDLPF